MTQPKAVLNPILNDGGLDYVSHACGGRLVRYLGRLLEEKAIKARQIHKPPTQSTPALNNNMIHTNLGASAGGNGLTTEFGNADQWDQAHGQLLALCLESMPCNIDSVSDRSADIFLKIPEVRKTPPLRCGARGLSLNMAQPTARFFAQFTKLS